MKKQYISPHIEETVFSATDMLALSGGEQTEFGIYDGSKEDAGHALSTPFRDWGF